MNKVHDLPPVGEVNLSASPTDHLPTLDRGLPVSDPGLYLHPADDIAGYVGGVLAVVRRGCPQLRPHAVHVRGILTTVYLTCDGEVARVPSTRRARQAATWASMGVSRLARHGLVGGVK